VSTSVARPFAVDGTVTAEKLAELMAVQTEYDALDYKAFLDPSRNDDRIEFTKDVASMQALSDGGYIVVGVDGTGRPTTQAGIIDSRLFDETALRQAVEKYLPPPNHLVAQVHVVDGISVALVYVGRRAEGFTIFKSQGQTSAGRAIFQAGDVFVRHGTSSERWQQHDLETLLKQRDRQVREVERARSAVALDVGSRAQSIARGPLGQITWNLSDEDFSTSLSEAVRVDEFAVVRAAVLGLKAAAVSAYVDSDKDRLSTVLDRLTAACAVCLTLSYERGLAVTLAQFSDLYDSPRDVLADNHTRKAAALWWEIVTRVEALGGLAVRLREWSQVSALATHRYSESPTYGYASWLRHGYVEAARANLITNSTQWASGAALVAFAREHAGNISALRPDVEAVEEGAGQPESVDLVLDSIAQFDLLWCTMAVAVGREHDHYPGFAFFAATRVRPVINIVLANPDVRTRLLPDASDEQWLESLRAVFDRARQQSLQSGRFWDMPIPGPQDFRRP
jgi:hypothetical protein